MEVGEAPPEVSLLLLLLRQPRAVQPAAVAVQTGFLLLSLPPPSFLLVPFIDQSLKVSQSAAVEEDGRFGWKMVGLCCCTEKFT